MRKSIVALSSIIILAAACSGRGADVSGDTQVLLDTDRAWARVASSGQNADSILAYWTDDAVVAMPGAPIVEGKNALRQMITSSMATPGFHISWIPEKAVVSSAGDMGYTTGTNEMTMPDSAGRLMKMTGRYITVWRKEPDGKWRCVQDYSSPAPAAT